MNNIQYKHPKLGYKAIKSSVGLNGQMYVFHNFDGQPSCELTENAILALGFEVVGEQEKTDDCPKRMIDAYCMYHKIPRGKTIQDYNYLPFCEAITSCMPKTSVAGNEESVEDKQKEVKVCCPECLNQFKVFVGSLPHTRVSTPTKDVTKSMKDAMNERE